MPSHPHMTVLKVGRDVRTTLGLREGVRSFSMALTPSRSLPPRGLGGVFDLVPDCVIDALNLPELGGLQ